VNQDARVKSHLRLVLAFVRSVEFFRACQMFAYGFAKLRRTITVIGH